MPNAFQNMYADATQPGISNARFYAAYNTRQLTIRDVAGAAKMGFQNLSQAEAFSKAESQYPNLKNLFTRVGNAAVPISGNDPNAIRMQNGNPVPTKYDSVMSAFGEKYRSDPRFLANLSRDIRENPRLEGQLVQAIEKNPRGFATSMRSYTGAQGQIENTVGRILNPTPPAARPQPAAAPAARPAAAPRPERAAPERPAAEKSTPSAPAPRVREPAVEPATAVAGATASASVSAPAAAAPTDGDVLRAPAPTGKVEGSAGITADDIPGMADQIAGLAERVFEGDERKPDIEGFRSRLKADTDSGKKLREDIATNLNNNPDFVNQMKDLAASDGKSSEQAIGLVRQYGRQDMLNIISKPENLASDTFVDGISKKLNMANGGGFDFGGMLKGLMNMIEQFVGPEFMQALSNLFDGVKDFFGGMGKGGNFLNQNNGTGGGLFANLSAGVGLQSQLGSVQESNSYAVRRENVAVIDKNGDNKIDDNDKFEFTDASGGKHSGYRLSQPTGMQQLADGKPVEFVVTEVNEKGIATKGTTILVDRGNVTTLDTATGQPVAPKPPEQDGPRMVAANGGKGPSMDRGMSPNDINVAF